MSRTNGNAHASSSRRQLRRAPESTPSDSEDEVLTKPRIRRDIANEQANGNGHASDEEVNEAEPEDPRTSWTTSNFENQPIDVPTALPLLRGLKSKLQSLANGNAEAIVKARETAVALEKASPDDGLLEKVQEGLLEFLEHRDVLKLRSDVIDELVTTLRAGEEVVDIQAWYESRAEEREREYREKTLRARFLEDDDFREFRDAIWAVNHEDEELPLLKRWLPREDGDESDDEVELEGFTQTYRCPLTMRVFQDACKSTACGHYYNYDAILQYIHECGRARRKSTCPNAGCHAEVTRAMIVKDAGMQRRANAFVSRQRREEEDEEVDVVE